MEENIEKIRKDDISKIKERVRKNPRYLHPMNKEFQEDMKRLKFANGNDFTHWMQQNGIMKNPADIKREEMKKTVENAGCKSRKEYDDKCARDAGFGDRAEQYRDYNRERRGNLPIEDSDVGSTWFGYISENYIMKTFEDPIKMPPNNPGFDWKCKKGEKIDHKGACLTYSPRGSPKWTFHIEYNNIADWFILSAWDDIDSLTPLHIWLFHKNDMVRIGKGNNAPKVKFWERKSITIVNTPKGIKRFEKWEVTDRLDRLKELCNRIKNISDESRT